MVSNMRMNNMHFMMPTLKQSTKKKAGFPLSLRVPYCHQWTQYFFVLRQRSQHFHHSFWSWLKNVSAWRVQRVCLPQIPQGWLNFGILTKMITSNLYTSILDSVPSTVRMETGRESVFIKNLAVFVYYIDQQLNPRGD